MSDLRLDLPTFNNGGGLALMAVGLLALTLVAMAVSSWLMRPKGSHWCSRGHAHPSRESAEHCDHPARQEVA